MIETLRFAVFGTGIGECAFVWSDAGIRGVHLPEADRESLVFAVRQAWLGAAAGGASDGTSPTGAALVETTPPPSIIAVMERVTALTNGQARDELADVTVDMSGLSMAMQRIYAEVRCIAPGETRTYGEVAAALGNPGLARAVGTAMGANPVPIIVPCHRVLGADSSIGGFSAHGGAATKRRLLLAEGALAGDGPGLFGLEAALPEL